jgi:nicotinamidase-related amidase
MSKNILICVDCQYDFCDPKGSLYVPGAEDDMYMIGGLIDEAPIDRILLSQDSHSPNSLFFPFSWIAKNGQDSPSEFYQIREDDEYTISPELLAVSPKMERKPTPYIWPIHCVVGSIGESLHEEISSAIFTHSCKTGLDPIFIKKGQDRYEEEYGIPVDKLDQYMAIYDKIIIVGEAKSHCVLETIKNILNTPHRPNPKNIYALIDCMSSIVGFEEQTENEFSKLGINLVKARNWKEWLR